MRSLARAIWLGVGVALPASLLLGALEGAQVLARGAGELEGGGERLRFVLAALTAPLLPGALAGVLIGLAGALVHALSRRLAGPSASIRTWIGRLLAVIAAPFILWICPQIFAGPRARMVPARNYIAAGIAVLLLWSITRLVPLLLGLMSWLDLPRRRRFAALAGGVCLLAAGAVYLIDQRVLPRLYPWFHLGLLVMLLSAALLSMVFFGIALRRVGAVLPLGHVAAGALFTALLGGALATWRFEQVELWRQLALDHTVGLSRLIMAASAISGRPLLEDGDAPGAEAEEGPELPLGPRLPDRDVFLITVDALRHDRLDARTMPVAAALAQAGVRFERAYTQVPHTSFAVATLLTGKPVYALTRLGKDAADHETLALLLRRARYKTAAFYPPSVFFIEHERLRRLEESRYGFEYVKYEYLPGDRRTDQVIEFLESERPERAFVWVHYLDPHEPYEVHPGGPGREQSDRQRYDGEISFVDRQIGRLLDHLRARGREGIIILASDHGEEFGEHGGRYHGTTLFEEQVRVPLLFAELGGPRALRPKTVRGPVGLIDVAPTLLGLLDIARSVRMRGHDLSPYFLEGTPEPSWPVYSEIGQKKMVVMGPHKLICEMSTDTCALHDLAADPGERRNLIDRERERARQLRALLGRYLVEASRFERDLGAFAGRDRAGARVLERARLGDRGVQADLAALMARERDPTRLRQATILLAELVVSEAVHGGPRDAPAAAVEQRGALASAARSEEAETRSWAQIGLFALGDRGRAAQVVQAARDPDAPPRRRVFAGLALVSSGTPGGEEVEALLEVLDAAMALDDPDLVRPLIRALGRSRDARVLPSLISHLGEVRSRADVAAALGDLALREAVPELSRLLAEDPYVSVRAQAAASLARIGGAQARGALAQALRREREAPVREAIRAALAPQSP